MNEGTRLPPAPRNSLPGVQTIRDLRNADRRELPMIPHVRSFGKVALALRGGCATGSVDPEVCNA
jgi:hypothetical protein